MKRILVLVSTYNGEIYLKELIESLLNQVDVDISILIRDDGSNDGTISLIKTLSNDKISFYQGENKRAVGSFLDLIEKAPLDYDYYAFCDQDDYWLNNKLKRAIERLQIKDNNKPLLYYSGQILADENLNIIGYHKLDKKRSKKANVIFNRMAGCTAVFNKVLLREMKEYYPHNIFGHDAWCYKLCVALDGGIISDDHEYIMYRQHGTNVVGLDNSFLGKIKRGLLYIEKYRPSDYAKEVLRGYNDKLNSKWHGFYYNLANANSSLKCRMHLLMDREIIFQSFFLRFLFIVKVLVRKM